MIKKMASVIFQNLVIFYVLSHVILVLSTILIHALWVSLGALSKAILGKFSQFPYLDDLNS